jgi:hypothetical protein
MSGYRAVIMLDVVCIDTLRILTMYEDPTLIQDANLSRAWAHAFLQVMQPGVQEIGPLMVTVTGFTHGQPVETPAIRHALDSTLTAHQKQSCLTVANTIFPRSLWNPAADRKELFERYLRILPHLKSQYHSQNGHGLYFERLIAFGSGPEKVNQLDHLIQTRLGGNRRRSALQAAIFDPAVDHTHQPRQGFPCLQHVTFTPQGLDGLAITAFYATQYLFERAYGNYVGLCNLGHFVAHELDRRLSRMTCITGIAMRGDANKA